MPHSKYSYFQWLKFQDDNGTKSMVLRLLLMYTFKMDLIRKKSLCGPYEPNTYKETLKYCHWDKPDTNPNHKCILWNLILIYK